MRHLVLLTAFVFLVAGCKKKATIDLPPPENKLVVTCFISPYNGPTAVVKLSNPVFGGGSTSPVAYDNVTDASVLLSDGVNNIVLTYDRLQRFYYPTTLHAPIMPGKTYYLTVTTPDGKYASASTTVPSQVTFSIDRFDVNIKKNDSISILYDSYVEIKDIPDETNYIALFYENVSVSNTSGFNHYKIRSSFVTDANSAKTSYIINYSDGFYEYDTIRIATLNVDIFNCNKDFYLYHESVQKAVSSNDNPFSDPVLVYTNINNGLGCFGAFTRSVHLQKRVK